MIRTVTISIHEHPHGDVPAVHLSADEARKRKIAIAASYWDKRMDEPMPEDPEAAAERYFGAAEEDGECFTVHTVDLTDMVVSPRDFWNPDDPWAVHDRFSRETWMHEVGSDYTSLGYIDWVNSQLENEALEGAAEDSEAEAA